MPRIPKSLRLDGYLRIAGRKWKRSIAVHRGGAFESGLMEFHLTGKAPGGFPQQIVQVSLYDACQWAFNFLVWAQENKEWSITKEELEKAKQVLNSMEP